MILGPKSTPALYKFTLVLFIHSIRIEAIIQQVCVCIYIHWLPPAMFHLASTLCICCYVIRILWSLIVYCWNMNFVFDHHIFLMYFHCIADLEITELCKYWEMNLDSAQQIMLTSTSFFLSTIVLAMNNYFVCNIRTTWQRYTYRVMMNLLQHLITCLQCIVSPACIVHSALYNIMHSKRPSFVITPVFLVNTVNRYFVIYAAMNALHFTETISSDYPWYKHYQTSMY